MTLNSWVIRNSEDMKQKQTKRETGVTGDTHEPKSKPKPTANPNPNTNSSFNKQESNIKNAQNSQLSNSPKGETNNQLTGTWQNELFLQILKAKTCDNVKTKANTKRKLDETDFKTANIDSPTKKLNISSVNSRASSQLKSDPGHAVTSDTSRVNDTSMQVSTKPTSTLGPPAVEKVQQRGRNMFCRG